jgi:hypothetical protein
MDIEQIEIPVDQPKEIYDADNDKMIPNPLLNKEESNKGESKKPASKAKSEETEEEEEEQEEETETEESEEESEEEESEEEESEEEEEQEDDPKDKNVLDSVDAVIEDTFGENFGVKTAAEIENLIDNALDLQD